MKKKILFCFTLISLGVCSQNYKGTIYFEDGTVRQGNTDFIAGGSRKINFQENNSTKTERIETKTIKKIEYLDSKTQEPIVFERLDYISGYKKNFTVPIISTAWFKKEKTTGDITAYSTGYTRPGHYNMASGNMFNTTIVNTWVFQYKNDQPKLIYWMIDGAPFRIKYQNIWINQFFKEICPSLVKEHLEKKLIIEDDPFPLLDFYNTNCNPNNK